MIHKTRYFTIFAAHRGVAQLASAPRSGRGGRKFESSHPDIARRSSSTEERRWASLFVINSDPNKPLSRNNSLVINPV